jgi:hypothetical protein
MGNFFKTVQQILLIPKKKIPGGLGEATEPHYLLASGGWRYPRPPTDFALFYLSRAYPNGIR